MNGKRAAHPATVAQLKSLHPARLAQPRSPHPATVAPARLLHQATVAQTKSLHPATTRARQRSGFPLVLQAMESKSPVAALAQALRLLHWSSEESGEFVGPRVKTMVEAPHFHNFLDDAKTGDLKMKGALCSLPKGPFEAGRVTHGQDRFGKKTKEKTRSTTQERREGLIVLACSEGDTNRACERNEAAFATWREKASTTVLGGQPGERHIEEHVVWVWKLLIDEILLIHLGRVELAELVPVPLQSVREFVVFYLTDLLKTATIPVVGLTHEGLVETAMDSFYSDKEAMSSFVMPCYLLAKILDRPQHEISGIAESVEELLSTD